MDEDLYVVNGFFSPVAKGDKNKFFKNEAGLFSDISSQLGVNSEGICMGLEVFDYDRDGDLDMLSSNKGIAPDLFHNQTVETDPSANWLQVQLEGSYSNRNAFGTIVKITCGSRSFFRYHSGVNLFGQSIKPIHFGLGPHSHVDELRVFWPSGQSEVFQNIPSNQVFTIRESDVTSTIEITDPKTILFFPNPFNDKLWLRAEGLTQSVFLQLTNVYGQLILEKPLAISITEDQIISIPNHDLKPGVYLYSLYGENTNYVGKIIKN